MQAILKALGIMFCTLGIFFIVVYADFLENREFQNFQEEIKNECLGYLSQHTTKHGQLIYSCHQNQYAYCRSSCQYDDSENTCIKLCLQFNDYLNESE